MGKKEQPFDDESGPNYSIADQDLEAAERECRDATRELRQLACGKKSKPGGDAEEIESTEGVEGWRYAGQYFTAVRRALESEIAKRQQEETVAGLKAKRPELSEIAGAEDLFQLLRPGSKDYDRKDSVFIAILLEHQSKPRIETLAVLVRVLLPRLMALAKWLCKRSPQQEWEEVCARVLAEFGEAVLRYPVTRLPRKVDVNLYFRTRKRFTPEARRRKRNAKAVRKLAENLRWIVAEVERCGTSSNLGVWGRLLVDDEPPAPYSDEERDDARCFAASLPLKKPLTALECRLIGDVDGCDRSCREVAAELGISEENARVKRHRLMKRLGNDLRAAGIRSVADYVTKFAPPVGLFSEGSDE